MGCLKTIAYHKSFPINSQIIPASSLPLQVTRALPELSENDSISYIISYIQSDRTSAVLLGSNTACAVLLECALASRPPWNISEESASWESAWENTHWRVTSKR